MKKILNFLKKNIESAIVMGCLMFYGITYLLIIALTGINDNLLMETIFWFSCFWTSVTGIVYFISCDEKGVSKIYDGSILTKSFVVSLGIATVILLYVAFSGKTGNSFLLILACNVAIWIVLVFVLKIGHVCRKRYSKLLDLKIHKRQIS